MTWTVKTKGDDVFIDCALQPYCEFCLNDGFMSYMKPFLMKLINFDLDPEGNNPTAYAIDYEMRCPSCGFHEVFGIAVRKEDFDAFYKAIKKPE